MSSQSESLSLDINISDIDLCDTNKVGVKESSQHDSYCDNDKTLSLDINHMSSKSSDKIM